MAIVIRATCPGMTREQYNGMSEQMLPQIKKTKGFLAHAGVPIPGGMQIVEFWEAQEDFDAWIKTVVKPASAAAGIPPFGVEIVPAERIVLR